MRPKSGIHKTAEFQFYFSAELRVATTNFHNVSESAGDHDDFSISDWSAKAQLWLKSTVEVQPYLDNKCTGLM